MDSFTQVLSQCHLGTANDIMDSPANFYECEDKQQFPVKQEVEQFDIEESNVGLFLQAEDSVDLQAYLDTVTVERFEVQQNNQVTNTGDAILRQLDVENFTTHQQMLTQTPATTPGAQPNQQPVQQHSINQMHYETISSMPQNTQAHVVEQAVPEYQAWMDINSTSTSAASSPGLPTSCDTFTVNEQPKDVQAQAPSSSGNGSGGTGSQKRKRPVPTPGTDEYKMKRERNNIAVRKSREKTKVKNRELQDKVGELQTENSQLKKRVEGLTRELTVLRSLFTTTGKTPPATLEKAVK